MMRKRLEKYLSFLIGLLCSMSYIGFQTNDLSIFALYNIPLVLLCIILLIKANGKIYLKKEAYPFYLLMLIFIISTFTNVQYLDSIWFLASMKATVKFVLIFGVLSLVIFTFDNYHIKDYFFKGLKIAIIVQCTWGLLGVSLNGIVLGDLMGIQPLTGTWSIITFSDKGEIFRVTGLSWEGANYSVLLVLGVILFDNLALRLYLILGIVLSTSRTGIMTLGLLLCFLFIRKFIVFFKGDCFEISRSVIKKAAEGFLLLVILAIYIYYSSYYESIEYVFDGITSVMEYQSTTNESTSRHALYYTEIGTVFNSISFQQILFGCGTFCAGYPYEKSFPELLIDGSVWNPESDVITLIMGNGVLGFLLYLLFLKNIYQFHSSVKEKGIVIIYLVAGIFYGQIRSWPMILFLVLLIDDSADRNQEFEIESSRNA